jgi:hypothetical protein
MANALNMAETISTHLEKSSKPGEMLDAQFTANALRNPPSLQALKLQDMLMKNAGGKIAEDIWHSMPLAAFKQIKGFRNLTHEDVVRLFEELRSVTMRHVNYEEGHTAVYGMIAVGRVDMDEGNGQLRYQFDAEFRKVIEKSDLYAVLDYRAGLAMSSRYAHRLHEMIAFRAGREKQVQRFTVEDLRSRLGVQTGKLNTWGNFKKFALDRAIEEVNQSSRFIVSYRVTQRIKRATAEIELAWQVKSDQGETKREQAAHSLARRSRRSGAKERIAFPESGGIAYAPHWIALKQKAGCNMDNSLIAEKFRAFCGGRGISLGAKNIEDVFVRFCARVGTI